MADEKGLCIVAIYLVVILPAARIASEVWSGECQLLLKEFKGFAVVNNLAKRIRWSSVY